MATITLSDISASVEAPSELIVVKWAAMANGDTGSAFTFGTHADRSVQVTGTMGAGGSVAIQGSLDGTNWFTLKDPFGGALTFSAAGGAQVTELVLRIRPIVTAGDVTTSIDVVMVSRRRR